MIVSQRFATLYELETVYSYADALDLYEIALVNSINEEKAYKAVKHGR